MPFKSVSEGVAGAPLGALNAVALDTETTGLDTAQARVVEIGGVRLPRGQTKRETFSQLVNPAEKIPQDAVIVHGITDDKVQDAPPFAQAMAQFAEWAGQSVLLGYSLGYDLAILRAECARANLNWRPPRALDVAHLMHALGGGAQNNSLDAAAGWLGVEIKDRHRALGDAIAAADVFAAMLPLLRKKGIVTLAQAERACAEQWHRLENEQRAGWLIPAIAPAEEREQTAEFARTDSTPYRYCAGEVMSSPPVYLSEGDTLQAAMKAMMAKGVSSLFAPPRADGETGILTERDILRALDAQGAEALTKPAVDVASYPLCTVNEDEFIYRAMMTMRRRNFRHLGVVNAAGELTGALTPRNLIRQRGGEAAALAEQLEEAPTPAALGRGWPHLVVVARTMADEDADSRRIAAVISRELRALTRRACQLAEAEMKDGGDGEPPCDYAVMVLGSGGRGESLLAMDQDNAIIFESGEAGGEADKWFAKLGARVADILEDAGVAKCAGGVMAANAEWRLSAPGWREKINGWLARTTPEDLLNADIFLDAAPVHGNYAMVEELMREAKAAAAASASFMKLLAMRAGRAQPPVGVFGRIKTEDGRVDLKMNGIMPIFSAARVAAIKRGIMARSTSARLAGAAARGAPENAAKNLDEAHRIMLGVILRQQLRDIREGLPLGNKIDPAALQDFDKDQLRWALEHTPAVADLLDLPPGMETN